MHDRRLQSLQDQSGSLLPVCQIPNRPHDPLELAVRARGDDWILAYVLELNWLTDLSIGGVVDL